MVENRTNDGVLPNEIDLIPGSAQLLAVADCTVERVRLDGAVRGRLDLVRLLFFSDGVR